MPQFTTTRAVKHISRKPDSRPPDKRFVNVTHHHNQIQKQGNTPWLKRNGDSFFSVFYWEFYETDPKVPVCRKKNKTSADIASTTKYETTFFFFHSKKNLNIQNVQKNAEFQKTIQNTVLLPSYYCLITALLKSAFLLTFRFFVLFLCVYLKKKKKLNLVSDC